MPGFSPQHLLRALSGLPACRRYLLAFSGGMDSHVLLHALASLRDRIVCTIQAVHVNHGLSAHASEWADHCRCVCSNLGIPLRVIAVNARPAAGQSPEAAARDARYQALAETMLAGDCLLTAHHQDDQAETLLLQLLRGCGPRGLAAMPPSAPFAAAVLARPLLGFTRSELLAYAQQQQLVWIDDPSNSDTSFRRNYLRHEVMPVLAAQWPACSKTLSRSAMLCHDAVSIIDEVAAEDWEQSRGEDMNTVRIPALRKLSRQRQRNVIRYWIQQAGYPQPHYAHIEQILQQGMHAADDRMPQIEWSGCEIHRYRDCLYAVSPRQAFTRKRILGWDVDTALALPDDNGILSMQRVQAGGISEHCLASGNVTVRYRRGGEICRPARRSEQKTLKKCMQELSIVPWLRERVPLIYIGDELAAVGDYFICQPFATQDGQGRAVIWQPGFVRPKCDNSVEM